MKTLLITRHAKSSWQEAGLSDHDRPLNRRGRSDAPKLGELLDEQDLVPDLILSSTATRARDTATRLLEHCDFDGELRLDRRLYHGEPDDYLSLLRHLPEGIGRVMVVGHNPGLEMLLFELTDSDQSLPTAALAQVELPIDRWDELDEVREGRLVQLWVPREL